MHKIALFALLSLPIFAGFFPATVNTTVAAVNGNSISLSRPFPVTGMSGIIIHKYAKEFSAITNRLVQTSSKGTATLLENDIIHHEELPTIKTGITRGDKVIGGYLYRNVLLLAPDADTYAKTTASHNRAWIHPDLYALFLSQEGEDRPTRENLAAFAKSHQVGLIYIIKKGSAVLLDPISGKIVGKKGIGKLPSKAQYPFYMRFDEIKTGWFSKSSKGGNYYNMVESL